MLHRLLDLLVCGSSFPCGEKVCTGWQYSGTKIHSDRATGKENPPIPSVVRCSFCQCDDVSALHEGSNSHPIRYDFALERLPSDLELRVESSCSEREGDTTEDSTDLGINRRFFAELYSTPLTTQRSGRSLLNDGDGSSYSTNHRQIKSWKTDSTDTTGRTRQTKNTFGPHSMPYRIQLSI